MAKKTRLSEMFDQYPGLFAQAQSHAGYREAAAKKYCGGSTDALDMEIQQYKKSKLVMGSNSKASVLEFNK